MVDLPFLLEFGGRAPSLLDVSSPGLGPWLWYRQVETSTRKRLRVSLSAPE